MHFNVKTVHVEAPQFALYVNTMPVRYLVGNKKFGTKFHWEKDLYTKVNSS